MICGKGDGRVKTSLNLFTDALNRPFLRIRKQGKTFDLLLKDTDFEELKKVFE